jgi:SAM-dependent methyltransferase
MPSDRERLKKTFESVAHQYHQARPDYPEALFDELVELTGVRQGDQLLEVGCGTGKATLPLARRGYEVTCIELGSDLAAEAKSNLAAYPQVTVIQQAFEAWEPGRPARQFDLLFAATAWHWIDPAVGYEKAWSLLKPGGHLAVWAAEHVIPVNGDTFFGEIQDVYDEIGEGLPPGTPSPTPTRCPTSAPRSRTAACSPTTRLARSTGRSGTPRRSTSRCSTRSPATSPWARKNATGSTARSGGGSRCGLTAC